MSFTPADFWPPGPPAGGAALDQVARDAAAAAQATANAAVSTGAELDALLKGDPAAAAAVSAALYVAVPDYLGTVGAGNDTAAINAAIATGRKVRFVRGAIYLTSGGHLLATAGQEIDLNGATLKIRDGTSVAAGTPSYAFQVTAANVKINDGVLDGNRANRTPAETANVHLLTLWGASDFSARGLTVKNGVCDGVYMGGPSPNVDEAGFTKNPAFFGCTFDNCYRNNVSIVAAQYWTFTACKFTNANGTSPQAGIDVEPNGTDVAGGCRGGKLIGCHAEGNKGFGYAFTSVAGCKDHELIGCTSRANLTGAILAATDGLIVIGGMHQDYNISTQTGGIMPAARGVIDVPASAGRVSVANMLLKGVKGTAGSTFGLYVHGSAAARCTFDKLRIEIDSTAAATFQGAAVNAPDCLLDRCEVLGAVSGGVNVTATLIQVNGVRDKVIGGYYTQATLYAIYCAGTDIEVDGPLVTEIDALSGVAAVRVQSATTARRIVNIVFRRAVSSLARPLRLDGTVGESWGHDIDANWAGTATADVSPPVQNKMSADQGDNSINFVWSRTGANVLYFNTPLAGARVVTLVGAPTAPATPPANGAWVRTVRTAAATGAPTLTAGGKALAAGQFVEHVFNGTAWIETAFGAL